MNDFNTRDVQEHEKGKVVQSQKNLHFSLCTTFMDFELDLQNAIGI